MQVFYFMADFADNPPLGLVRGPGGAAAIFKVDEDGSRTLLDPIGDVSLEPGERVAGNEAGGGGYGAPELDAEPRPRAGGLRSA